MKEQPQLIDNGKNNYLKTCIYQKKALSLHKDNKERRLIMEKKFEELTADELWTLRTEITLNSLYIADYHNSFGFKAKHICYFFDGYMDFIYELCEEKGLECVVENAIKFDNKTNLESWFNCFDDLSWIEFEEDEE